ncbi:19078_t:CDS:2 [Rhizophagus irregularis]|nr:19078_t:CDS:2 [Rhizophagus irregularis]
MVFNQAYSDLLAKLPASLINEAWIRLTSQKCKPLSEKKASEINPIVKSFLKHEASSSETRAPELAFEYKLLPFAFVMAKKRIPCFDCRKFTASACGQCPLHVRNYYVTQFYDRL